MVEHFPEPSPTHITYLHKILDQFIKPFALCNFSKILSREMLYEASASLVDPNGMKLFGHLHIFKSLGHAHFQIIPSTYVTATSSSLTLAIMTLSTTSTL